MDYQNLTLKNECIVLNSNNRQILNSYDEGLDHSKQRGTFDFSHNLIKKHRQVFSTKFPKSFRDAGYLMVFYEFFRDF